MKKSLSILLALLMILSSLPIMTFAASAEQADPNVMADYTYANWQTRRWGSSNEGTESLNGGTSIYLKSVNYQTAFTTVTLEPNTTYLLDFNWKSDTNENLNGIFLRNLFVFGESTYGSNEALLAPAPSSDLGNYVGSGSWHHDNGAFYPAGATAQLTSLGADLESETADTTARSNATAGTWQHIATKFTTNSTDTEYAIMVDFQFNSTGNAGPNNIHLSDFILIDQNETAKIPLEQKTANHFDTFRWTKVNKTEDPITVDGTTSMMRVDSCISHRVFTTIPAKNVKENEITFKYYSGSGITVSGICVYPDTVGGDIHCKQDETNPSNGWYEGDIDGVTYYAQFVPGRLSANPSGIQTQRTCGADASTTWQTATVKFPSVGAETYHLIIEFGGNNATGNTCYFADFTHTGTGLSKEGNLLNNATYANGSVSWTTTTDVDNRVGNVDAWGGSWNDNYTVSYDGGYSWAFGFGDGKVGGDDTYTDQMYLDTYGYVYIKANDLKADATYDFSFINRFLFKFMPHSIAFADGTNAATNLTEPKTEILSDSYSEKTSYLFKVPVDGDYVITLKANRANCVTNQSWNMNGLSQYGATVLCDLELYERGALYTVAVDTEGNGAAKADKTGLIEEGTEVTFNATPEVYERFLGWYVGDELVSEEEVYTTTVAGDLNPVAKFTANGENLMANYDTSKFVARYWGNVLNAESRYGGLGIRADKVPHQNLVTKANLEAGKEYTLSFEWKSVENISNKDFVTSIKVCRILTPEIDVLGNKDDTWADGSGYKGQFGEDIELGGGYSSQEIANTCTWQNITTTFTPTESGEYAIIIGFGHNTLTEEEVAEINSVHGSNLATNANNNQSVDLSDFVLKAEPVIEYTGTHYDWNGVHWSEVTDSAETRDGGYAYKVAKAMSQNINTTLNLKPGTTYRYSFNWKSVANDKGLAFVQSSSIYSAKSGDPSKGSKTNYDWYDENDSAGYVPIYVPNEGYSNLMTDVSNPNGSNEAEDSVLKGWNTYSATFTTIEDEDYYLFLNFGLKGAIGNQDVIVSDFVIEEVVKGSAPAADEMIDHPGVSIRKASESTFGQALRYKFTIDASVIDNAQADGYELTEYGTVVARVDQLAGHAADPIMNATSYTVKKGVAYNKADGTNIQFSVAANGDVTYTAALYNIPTENYSSRLAVRPYAVFTNADGDSYVRYGTTRVASVFEVAKAILEGSNSDDIAYVNNVLLAGDIKAAYDAWVAEQ
ncbi:MAG: hypothetical protein IJC36_02120 [Clostridia bacterium]|nr:hypothetical protein [Clostridia bacterium]